MRALKIDHVHIEVRDRDAAADWYQRTLGLVRYKQLASWADDKNGPLILSAGDGNPALSLFRRDCGALSRDATIAFRVSGEQFVAFMDELSDLRLLHRSGKILSRGDVVDHALSWSLYFLDPDENRLEVTSYDYAQIAGAVGGQ
ncbi:VOC family protein [Rhizobium sp. Root1220]|uniref:VOC family protein n=1 Tax=Rhizobium sp. Root1220 TaxID=1736432 RepID=UPI00138EFBA7|nr:VOC family protein [Rhizobium sp. Root1220]